MTTSETRDWMIVRWKADELSFGICRARENPWDELKLERSVPIEVRAMVYSTTREKAQEVLEILQP
jgi:hypothetical protein